jgi:hypothetical protein
MLFHDFYFSLFQQFMVSMISIPHIDENLYKNILVSKKIHFK